MAGTGRPPTSTVASAKLKAFPSSLSCLQFCHAHREPLHPRAAEVDLHPGVGALPLGVDDHPRPEFRMHHVLADAEAADIACGFLQRFSPSGKIRRERLLFGEARREPFHQLLRDLLEEARWNV